MSAEMIERAVRAMFDAGRMSSIAKWETFSATPSLIENVERLAVAAISVLLEPTAEMIRVGGGVSPEIIYLPMIREALGLDPNGPSITGED